MKNRKDISRMTEEELASFQEKANIIQRVKFIRDARKEHFAATGIDFVIDSRKNIDRLRKALANPDYLPSNEEDNIKSQINKNRNQEGKNKYSLGQYLTAEEEILYGVIEKNIPYFLYQREEQKNIPAVLERGKFLSSRDTNSNNLLPEEGKAKGVNQVNFFTLGPENCGKPELVGAAPAFVLKPQVLDKYHRTFFCDFSDFHYYKTCRNHPPQYFGESLLQVKHQGKGYFKKSGEKIYSIMRSDGRVINYAVELGDETFYGVDIKKAMSLQLILLLRFIGDPYRQHVLQAAKANQQDKAQLDIISESIKELVWVELRQCRRLPTEGNLGKIAIESVTGKEKIEADINRSLNDDNFKFILESYYKQAAEDFYNMTQAIQESDHKKLEDILKNGANPDMDYLPIKHRSYPLKDGYTLLFLASYLGDLQSVKLLLAYGAKLDLSIKIGSHKRQRALDIAAARGHTEIVSYLIQGKTNAVDPMIREVGSLITRNNSDDYYTPLESAFKSKQYKTAEKIMEIELNALIKKLKAGGPIDDINDRHILNYACSVGDVKTLDVLIKQLKMDPNKLDLHGNGLLLVAVQHHQLAVVEFLIKSGVSSNEIKTALIEAAQNNNEEMVQCLINNRATHLNVNDCLLAVIKNQNKDAAKLLIKHGAKGDQLTSSKKTCIHYVIKHADENDYDEMLTLLVSLGCDLNVKNKHDETPIEMIFDLGAALIDPLLDGLDDLDSKFYYSGENKTLCEIAIASKNERVIEALGQKKYSFLSSCPHQKSPIEQAVASGELNLVVLMLKFSNEPLTEELLLSLRPYEKKILALFKERIKEEARYDLLDDTVSSELDKVIHLKNSLGLFFSTSDELTRGTSSWVRSLSLMKPKGGQTASSIEQLIQLKEELFGDSSSELSKFPDSF